MAVSDAHLGSRLLLLDQHVGKLRVGAAMGTAIRRFHADAQALLFHLTPIGSRRPLAAVLGGTGTGKSTLVNRLLGAEVSATSFRRTFTSGPVAIAERSADVPEGWLGLERQTPPAGAPVRGEVEKLNIVELTADLTAAASLIDTPDLDGDQPLHHAEADRVFRWADAVVFLVTPEKYQMTELLPYYRLAHRYALPAVFVMNKCEESAVLDDYRKQLATRGWPDARVFAVPRDDAAYEPPADAGLPALRQAVVDLAAQAKADKQRDARQQAIAHRRHDLVDRLRDQVLVPLKVQRQEIGQLVHALRAMAAPSPGVDVSPLMQQIQRRLQEQSVLYLMGPQRILQRARQLPGMVLRLPRTAWDLLVHGRVPQAGSAEAPVEPAKAPDFPSALRDQFCIFQSRIDDLLRGSAIAAAWTSDDPAYPRARIDPTEAERIAEQELAELKSWLEQRWQGTPRDTAVLNKLLRYIPGGKAISKWSEATPYLMAVILATHGALFGPIDLMVFGSYSVFMWIAEKLSNEVASRTRLANTRIAQRFVELGQRQINQTIAWLNQQAPELSELQRLEGMADEIDAGRLPS